jgi:plasmid maintenance system antidote protein VapI
MSANGFWKRKTRTVSKSCPRKRHGTAGGVAIRGGRGKEGLTQKQLAGLTGIAQHHISEMENGKRPIGKETARKLAAALNIDYRFFL